MQRTRTLITPGPNFLTVPKMPLCGLANMVKILMPVNYKSSFQNCTGGMNRTMHRGS